MRSFITLTVAALSVATLTARAAEFDDVRGSWALTADQEVGVLFCPHVKIDTFVTTFVNGAGRTNEEEGCIHWAPVGGR